MSDVDVTGPLIRDLVSWIAERPRPYADVMDAWRTSCPRLTIWEATHHLIRALDQGEQPAAALQRKLGLISETARDLSYRLYTVCERRKWAQEAIGYNALVLAWPDLTRLAQEQTQPGLSQGQLI